MPAAQRPNAIDASVHPGPIGMGHRTVVARERREGRWRHLGGTKAGGHERGGRHVEAGVEVAANDARGHVVALIDPCQQLLNLKQPQRIVAAHM